MDEFYKWHLVFKDLCSLGFSIPPLVWDKKKKVVCRRVSILSSFVYPCGTGDNNTERT